MVAVITAAVPVEETPAEAVVPEAVVEPRPQLAAVAVEAVAAAISNSSFPEIRPIFWLFSPQDPPVGPHCPGGIFVFWPGIVGCYQSDALSCKEACS